MAKGFEYTVLTQPRIYLIRMIVFVILAAFVGAILYPQINVAFMANPGLNGLIIGVLVIGIGYAFRLVWRLFPEVNWVNNFRVADPGLEVAQPPTLLGPMATLLRDRQGRMVLTPMSMRSLLDSLASRLDESRDISRYLIGLLVFLGLLGTFWGLLQTVSSVGDTIRSLDVTSGETGTIFEELKSGLAAPLQGMGTAFSSSLFGLAGSLVLGFLDLQASQAQNRFYTDLEDWLSSVTDIEAGDAASASSPFTVPNYLQLDLRNMQESLERINKTLDEAVAEVPGEGDKGARTAADVESISLLAEAVQDLVRQMREEQKMVRDWAQAQADQHAEMKVVLDRLASNGELRDRRAAGEE